jgi:CxxC motif-containing protein (DUF1111 family)
LKFLTICIFTSFAYFQISIGAHANSAAALPGGTATYQGKVNKKVFSHPSANISKMRGLDFIVGQAFFERLWVTAPSSTQASDGLGPLYNARACIRCHKNNGRGITPSSPEERAVSLFLQLSTPPSNDQEQALLDNYRLKSIPDPVYGIQLQNFSTATIEAEGMLLVEYEEVPATFEDGRVVYLRKPTYSIKNPAYGPPHEQLMMSPRLAPQMIGLGLLEAISDEDLLTLADPDDEDRDGISGKPNRVWSRAKNEVAIGRFGWKAGNATVDEQSQSAFFHDIGISTPLYPGGAGECTSRQEKCLAAPTGDSPQYSNLEAPEQVTEVIALFARNIAVPARRKPDHPEVLAGEKLFKQAGCPACHQPSFTTRPDFKDAELAGQTIWPYTDLLLHDMGSGLADHRPEGAANGREWRTPPLWGIGLTEIVTGQTNYLHDGRARSIIEAILWHGGEAEEQKRAVLRMNEEQVNQLIHFVESL